ncbi:MAG: Dolichol-phosphate mannosyltransferase [Parcubacteria group bacterium GW2011_GWA2_47_10b]|nr:MAG: Dolichol-phosphate mannosyltransferase [Parcubacteria group bacterium GW2011_GWA2_47_10b]KKU86376.1 MAG: Dolichol-phosphate mannosyltransferase [Parcubacteria group bacterium GW2011_GWA1_47_9]
MISIIIPIFNEEDTVQELHRRIMETMSRAGEEFEVIAVNDGSNDQTRERLLSCAPLTLISFVYRMGQSAAIDAGLHAASGDTIVTIDADLQNAPEDIPKLLEKMNEGYDFVGGLREQRDDTLSRKVFSRFANWVTRKMTGLPLKDYGCALRAFRKDFIRDVHLYGVMHVFLAVIFAARGARITEIPVRHSARKGGKSKYTIFHIATDIADLLVIQFLYRYVLRPLTFFGGWAIVSAIIGFLFAGAAIVLKLLGLFHFTQTPFPIIAVLFIILGFLLFMLGFIAEILLRIYYEGRKETPYKIKEVLKR